MVYQIDRFVYNSGMNRRVAPQATFRSLGFHGNKTPDGKGVLELRNLVIYRGGDIRTRRAAGFSAEGDADGVRLAWKRRPTTSAWRGTLSPVRRKVVLLEGRPDVRDCISRQAGCGRHLSLPRIGRRF